MKLKALEEWSKDAVIILKKTRDMTVAEEALSVCKGEPKSKFAAHLIKCIDLVLSDLDQINTIIECRK